MLVKHLFSSLMERLEGIESEWSHASTSQKQELCRQLLELRKVSDDILDHWLELEERIVRFQKRSSLQDGIDDSHDYMPDAFAEKMFQSIKDLHDSQNPDPFVTYLCGHSAQAFRKGQGYYDLFMFTQAVEQFQSVIQEDPDLDMARMYLGFSLMMAGNMEEAEYHFQILSKTTSNHVLRALVENARGCLFAARQKWEQSLHCFTQAVNHLPPFKDALFNKALAYMKMNKFHDAKQVWLEYCRKEERDWEAQLQLAKCHQADGEIGQAEDILRSLYHEVRDSEALWEVGKHYEDLRQFGNAALCYHLILKKDPASPGAWHGLGWNLWHEERRASSLNYIKKAMTLSPHHPDFLFSFGWILVHIQEWDKAERVFSHILELDPAYSLAMAGMIQIGLAREQWEQAEAHCQRLISLDHNPSKALGYLQMGRLHLSRGEYSLASSHLEESIRQSPELKDSYLLLGLIHYLEGKREEAMVCWEKIL